MEIAVLHKVTDHVQPKTLGFVVILTKEETLEYPEGIFLSKEEWMQLAKNAEGELETWEEMLQRFDALPFEGQRAFIRDLERNLERKVR